LRRHIHFTITLLLGNKYFFGLTHSITTTCQPDLFVLTQISLNVFVSRAINALRSGAAILRIIVAFFGLLSTEYGQVIE